MMAFVNTVQELDASIHNFKPGSQRKLRNRTVFADKVQQLKPSLKFQLF